MTTILLTSIHRCFLGEKRTLLFSSAKKKSTYRYVNIKNFYFYVKTPYFDKKKYKHIQVSPVTMCRLGSTNLIRDICGTCTNEEKHEQLYLSQCGWGMFVFRKGSEFF